MWYGGGGGCGCGYDQNRYGWSNVFVDYKNQGDDWQIEVPRHQNQIGHCVGSLNIIHVVSALALSVANKAAFVA